jgi:hypothetical protein
MRWSCLRMPLEGLRLRSALLPSSPPCLRRRKPETASSQRRRLLSRIREEARVASKRLWLYLGANAMCAAACLPVSLALRPSEAPTPLAASRAIDSVVSSMTALPPVNHDPGPVSLRRTTREPVPMPTEACQTNLCCPPSLVVKDTHPCPASLRHKPHLAAQPVPANPSSNGEGSGFGGSTEIPPGVVTLDAFSPTDPLTSRHLHHLTVLSGSAQQLGQGRIHHEDP